MKQGRGQCQLLYKNTMRIKEKTGYSVLRAPPPVQRAQFLLLTLLQVYQDHRAER